MNARSSSLPVWTGPEYGGAMGAYIEAHAKKVRRRLDRIECEAFYRGGDNPCSLVVFLNTGAWADARTGVKGGARDFAKIVAGQSLIEFMAQWGIHSGLTPSRAQEQRTPTNLLSIAAEARDVWAQCSPVIDDPDVARFLEQSRGLDAGLIADLDLARAITMNLPRWASCGGDWWTRGYRLVVPLVDQKGEMVSLHARNIFAGVEPKAVSPAGQTTRGLVMADRLARGVLSGSVPFRDWIVEITMRRRESAVGAALVICEGLPDFLSWASFASDADEDAPGVIAVLSGSWTQELADRVPDGISVCIATHDDASGNAYAKRIAQSFNSRVAISRWRAP